ncbi:transcriptional regulator [Xanthomonas euvesicatoria]|uniref:transcriptional regulator n=1 Tax=Xanthomonas euvesicatoria TaxID=456327 RepID=UPI001C4730AB|nr:transcriptional regulator [Xanthomonas euvesicatoria]MBV6831309.1 transcriptional regulator [Xanthomonas campestris pv. viegasii]
MTNDANIRLECLKPAERWTQPTGEEIREVLRLAGLSGSKAAKALGLGAKGDRTIRRWIGEDTAIPYAAWAILCDLAELGAIWKED